MDTGYAVLILHLKFKHQLGYNTILVVWTTLMLNLNYIKQIIFSWDA